MDKKQLKVLLIEDQQKNATEIKNGLIALGFDVAVSGSVDRGLCRAKAYRFDMFVVIVAKTEKTVLILYRP